MGCSGRRDAPHLVVRVLICSFRGAQARARGDALDAEGHFAPQPCGDLQPVRIVLPALPRPPSMRRSICRLKPSLPRHQVRFRSFDHQVIVVRHQAVRMPLPARLPAGLGQGLDEIMPICIIQEDSSRRWPRFMRWYMAPGDSRRSLRGTRGGQAFVA